VRLLAVAVAILVAATPARADQAEAQRLFDEARKLLDQGNTVEACKLFAKSLELERAPGTLLNLGDCAEREGTPHKAWQLFDEAARELEGSGQLERARFARNRADAVLANFPEVRTGTQPDAGVRDVPPLPPPSVVVVPARPEPASDAPRSQPRPQPRPSNLPFKIVAATGLGLSAIGAVVWGQAYGVIEDFESSDMTVPLYVDDDGDGTYQQLESEVLTNEDCARTDLRNTAVPTPNRNGLFDESCSAHARSRWAIPMTIGFGIVGVGSLMYLLTRSDPDPHPIAITPLAVPDTVGASVHVSW
jgi:hypothetical protein